MPPEPHFDFTAERDSITGLHSRRAFSRQVNQVFRDGDPHAVALISLEDFDTTAQVAGFQASDDLLSSVGRALLDHLSATTTVARTGDHQFGILTVGLDDDNTTRWASPVVTSIKLALSRWVDDHANFSLNTIAPPKLRVGVATGVGQDIWDQAGLALSTATDNVDGDDVVYYRKEDQRIQSNKKRIKRDNELLEALVEETLMVANQRIELAGRSEQSWAWFRLTAAVPARGSSFDLIPSFQIAPAIGRQIEQFVFQAASKVVTTEDGPVRVTVPVSRELLASRSFNERLFPILERSRIPPSRVVFEIEEKALRQSNKRGAELIKKLDQIGSKVSVYNCSGNWDSWELCTQLPVSYITPTLDLYDRFSEANSPAFRVLSSMAATCDEFDIEMIAPFSSRLVPASMLNKIGITHIERAPTIGTARQTAPLSDIGFTHP